MNHCGFQAVLWDLDDTLYSRADAARKMFPGMFRQCLYTDRSDAFIQQAVDYMMTQAGRHSVTQEAAFQALLARYPSDKPYIRSQCIHYYYEHIRDYVHPFPETVEILRKLKSRNIKLAIVTNITPELLEHQRKKVDALGIGSLFDAVVYSAEFGVHKPDRRIFDHAAALLGVPNEQCLFVGDDPQSDVAGALSAGMEVVWLDRWQTDDPMTCDPRVHRVVTAADYFGA
ncbi:MAG: HAD family hydrolase [Oscillospiraceae bacterium]|nr:HAD family hydrolase [Oscillospiraceae bacterium]